jgi:transcription antitermination factor NusG
MSYWACAQIEIQREKLALHCLSRVNGFEIYSPRISAPPSARRNGDNTRPLFPGYCFVLIVLQWHAARWSPGVVRLVSEGMVPARVPDRIIDTLRKRERRGVIELPAAPKIHVGDPVRVPGGPFEGQLGLYAGMKPRARVEVLLTLLGSQQRVTLPQCSVELAPDSGGL